MKMIRFLTPLLCLAVVAGCATGKTAKKGPGSGSETADADGSATPGVEVSEANIRGSEFAEIPELENIQFAYDAYTLEEPARNTLKSNAEYLKTHRDLEVLVAGHCDERGTIQYNLALGQKRARVVREYYMRLGIPGKSIATISYGEEKPLCMESLDSCWSRNRRAETRIRARTASNHKDGAQSQVQ